MKKSEGGRLNHSMMNRRTFPHLDAAAHHTHDRPQLRLLVEDAKARECVMTIGGATMKKKTTTMMTKRMISEREIEWYLAYERC